MNAHQIAIVVLLWIGVVTTVVCVLGMLLMKDFFEKLHYMAPVSTIAAGAITAAVFLQEGWGQAGIKAALVLAVSLVMNAVLTHATARAARIRALGTWTAQPDESIPGTYGRGEQAKQRDRRTNE